MCEVKDKVFIITGGAAGIGAGACKAFLDGGAKHVAALDVDVKQGQALEAEMITKHGAKRLKFYKCDVTTKDLEDCFDAVFREFGYIDCVVNCAGIMNESSSALVKEIDINVTALIRGSLKAYELMRKDHGGKGGTVINISSIAGIFQCNVVPIYSATKSAVLQFTNCMGMEPYYPLTGVRFITICFGVTDTSIIDKSKYKAIDKESDNADIIGKILEELPAQSVESAVTGLVEAFKRGNSASTWLITSNKPAQDITHNVVKGYQTMSQGIFDK